MFGDTVKKNRRLNVYELQDEIETAKAFCRPVKSYIYDTPYYPFFPPTPIVPKVNFNLNFK